MDEKVLVKSVFRAIRAHDDRDLEIRFARLVKFWLDQDWQLQSKVLNRDFVAEPVR